MTSIARNPQSVRLSYKDENNQLIVLEKLQSVDVKKGNLLKPMDGVLVPTNDRHSAVAKLLAHPNTATETKTMQFGLINKTLYLLPIHII